MAILTADNLTKQYTKHKKSVLAVDHFTYQFQPGKLYAILGESGAGKTTLLSILGGLEKPSDGQLYFEDRKLSGMKDRELSQWRKSKIGFIFQSSALCQNLSALENVMLPILAAGIPRMEACQRAEALLDSVGLSERADFLPQELSGGEKQRIAFIRAIANDPELILADEPTGNLDEKNEKLLFERLSALAKEGRCVIIVSHNPQILHYADCKIVLSSGRRLGADG